MIPYENLCRPKTLTYERVRKKALEIFDHDIDKTNHWWITKQKEFDGLSPYEMVKNGKGRKLMKILERCVIDE